MTLTIAIAALGRPTFDVPFAEEKFAQCLDTLDKSGIKTIGPRKLLFDAEAAEEAIEALDSSAYDALLIIQVTFTDATITAKLAEKANAPIVIWALPEPRLGGRLRLNAFCGLNLAAHALGKRGIDHGWLWADPTDPNIKTSLLDAAKPNSRPQTKAAKPTASANDAAAAALAKLKGVNVSVIGQHPQGFDTCSFNEKVLNDLLNGSVKRYDVGTLFEKAKSVDSDRVASVRKGVESALANTDSLDQDQFDRSIRVFCALEDIQKESDANGLAVRCWPEMFTEYGCAACGPMAMMNEKRVPSACEADVYGSISTLILQSLGDDPVWMADLVDLDFEGNTGVFWHCGLAPLSMCDPEEKPTATIHTNRKMPLLHEFALKPGRITIARLSQALGEHKLVIGSAEVLREPKAFTGTSGVVRFDTPATKFCNTLIDEGLEHHYAITYGDHKDTLKAMGAALNLPVLELC